MFTNMVEFLKYLTIICICLMVVAFLISLIFILIDDFKHRY